MQVLLRWALLLGCVATLIGACETESDTNDDADGGGDGDTDTDTDTDADSGSNETLFCDFYGSEQFNRPFCTWKAECDLPPGDSEGVEQCVEHSTAADYGEHMECRSDSCLIQLTITEEEMKAVVTSIESAPTDPCDYGYWENDEYWDPLSDELKNQIQQCK